MLLSDMTENQPANIVIGAVLGAHGREGEMSVRVLTEFPERFEPGAQFYIEGAPYSIEKASVQTNTAILRLKDVNTAEAANLLRGKTVEIPESERKELPAGRYYQNEIIGLEVWTTTGTLVGKVSDILSTGGNDIYVVKDNGKEMLIPAVKNVVKEIDIAGKRITIEAIEGLLD